MRSIEGLKQRECDHSYDTAEFGPGLEQVLKFNYCPWCGAKLSDPNDNPNDDCQKKGCAD